MSSVGVLLQKQQQQQRWWSGFSDGVSAPPRVGGTEAREVEGGGVQPEEERRKGGMKTLENGVDVVDSVDVSGNARAGAATKPTMTATGGGAGVGDPRGASKAGSADDARTARWTPRTLASSLDYYVIGQGFAKRTLAVGVYNHYKRVGMKKQASLPHSSSSSSSGAAGTTASGAGGTGVPTVLGEGWPQSLVQSSSEFGRGRPGTITISVQPPPTHEQQMHRQLEQQQQQQQKFEEQHTAATTSSDDDEATDGLDPNLKTVSEEVELDKSNILLCGPTGSGKTLLVKTLARFVNVPFVIADATTLTQAYVTHPSYPPHPTSPFTYTLRTHMK